MIVRAPLKSVLLLSSALIATPALAQSVLNPPPPTEYILDDRGVDLISGTFNLATMDVVIGQPGQGGLTYERTFAGSGWRDNLTGTLQYSSTNYVASFGGHSEAFTRSGTTFTPVVPNGATLVKSGNLYTWTLRDGTQLIFDEDLGGGAYTSSGIYSRTAANAGRIVQVKLPNGETREFHYEVVDAPETPTMPPMPPRSIRLVSVTNNFGYQIHVRYPYAFAPENWEQLEIWLTPSKVTGLNNAVDYCYPLNQACTFTRTWPSATYAQNSTSGTVTDQSGRVTTYSYASGAMTGVKLPGSASNDLSISYASGRVSSVQVGTDAWNYAYSTSGDIRTTTLTDPLSQTWQATGSISTHLLSTWRDPLLRTQSFGYSAGRLSQIVLPEGQATNYVYDGRGNVTQATVTPKAGSGLSPIVTSAVFPATCTTPTICNQPTATTDARGAVTDYTYDSAHGGLLTVTSPAPTSGSTRPQTRISYAAQTAYYKDIYGTIVPAPSSVTLPSAVSSCASGSAPSCVSTASESRTTVTYGAVGVANNLLPTVVTNWDGTGSLSASQTITYTANGDVASVDGPLSGTSDTTNYRYDDARQMTGVIGPDLDGSGPLQRRAQRLTYNPRGAVTLSEQGTVTGLTDPNWAAFNSLQQFAIAYDGLGRPTHQRLQSGGTTYSLLQTNYDAAGRVDCTVQRMNPTTFASPPSSACTLATQGSFGSDRAIKYGYDVAGQLTSTTSGFGSGATITESATYDVNSQPLTLTDGKGNVSRLVYDGFGRVSRLCYPGTTNCATATTGYEGYDYDAASNVTSYRTRANQTFTTAYDFLNRPTAITAPAGTPSLSYAYDNLGRLLTANNGTTITRAWDALGRLTSETGPLGTMAYQYDLAGRRTRQTWPDAFFVTNTWNLYGEMAGVLHGGTTSIVGLTYDDLGRRTGISRSNGVTTAYGYDGASRLTSLSHDVGGGAAADVSYGYSYNPAGQITSKTTSNTAYLYAPAAGSTAYTINGLNQVTAAGGSALTWSANGNLTNDATRTFSYDAANRLTGSGTASLSYDALGRLDEYVGTQGARYLYDGVEAVGFAISGATINTRFIRGPGTDEVLASYTATGPVPAQFWLSDERGSLVDTVNGSTGASTAINTYDEYGDPGAANVGRFQYTGQLWLPSFGTYHYKARAYAPGLGRFMQTDPLGYQAGMNLYAYVGADPINFTDPLGLQQLPNEDGGAADLGDIVVVGTRLPPRCGFLCNVTRWIGGVVRSLNPREDDGACGSAGYAGPLPSTPPATTAAPTAAATVSRAGTIGMIVGGASLLSGDSQQPRVQWVVRGGIATPESLIRGTSTLSFADAPSGFSVSSSPNMTVNQIALAARYPNSQISYASIQGLRQAGANVVPTPLPNMPLHHTVVVPNPLSKEQAALLSTYFRQTPNPAGCRRR